MRPPRSIGLAGLGVVLTAAFIGGTVPAHADTTAPGPITEEAVAEFLDERVPELLEEFDTPGAGVSVVSGDGAVYEQGYGVMDLESEEEVTADTSFAMASVSKSFTAMALLQLVDQGKVELNTDVNEFLPDDTQFPDTFDEPITLHHLLTHTAGLEEAVTGMSAAEGEEVMPLHDYVRDHLPERVHPPGRFTSYSNYGTAMAGAIVQEVSGQDFDEYIAEHVFEPLGMQDSAFTTPDGADDMFDGTPTLYTYGAEGNTPALRERINATPAGAGYASISDIGRFMQTMLNEGEANGGQVLSPESTQLMLEPQSKVADGLSGTGYGTWERTVDPVRVVGHSGDLSGGHTEYALVPELDLGVYVAVNSDGKPGDSFVDLRMTIVSEVLAEFAGDVPPDGVEASGGDSSEEYTGTYVTTRVSESDPSSLKTAMDRTTVTAGADGALQTVNSSLGGASWVPIGDGVFQSETGDRMAFIEEGGEVVGLSMEPLISQAYERVEWYADSMTHVFIALGALVVMATAAVWPVTALVRRIRGRDASAYRGVARYARPVAGVTVLTCAGFVGVLIYALTAPGVLENWLFTGSQALTLPLAIAVTVALGMVVGVFASWSRGWWTLSGRIHYTVVALAAIVFLSIGANYNMVVFPA